MRTANAITGSDGHVCVINNMDNQMKCGFSGHGQAPRNIRVLYEFEEIEPPYKYKNQFEKRKKTFTLKTILESCPLGVEAFTSAGFPIRTKIVIYKAISPAGKRKGKMIGRFIAVYKGGTEYGLLLKGAKYSLHVNGLEVRSFVGKGK